MEDRYLINDKENFMSQAIEFFKVIFGSFLERSFGEIEIRIFPKEGPARNFFFNSESEAAEKAFELCNAGRNVYFGVNPRIGKAGKKENIKYLSAFHAEIDYGKEGHKKDSKHQTYDQCLKAIQEFQIEPTIIIHSGGGFHCYWVLSNPIKVEDYGVQVLESVNKALILNLGGDSGTQNIDRVLRVPGTFNLKNPDAPRLVQIVSISNKRYAFDDFKPLMGDLEERVKGNAPKQVIFNGKKLDSANVPV